MADRHIAEDVRPEGTQVGLVGHQLLGSVRVTHLARHDLDESGESEITGFVDGHVRAFPEGRFAFELPRRFRPAELVCSGRSLLARAASADSNRTMMNNCPWCRASPTPPAPAPSTSG
jgi:hypothetical protein